MVRIHRTAILGRPVLLERLDRWRLTGGGRWRSGGVLGHPTLPSGCAVGPWEQFWPQLSGAFCRQLLAGSARRRR
ncbi:hypothetical protein NDU88_005392 [Pleurodeles waltl]|uniref:Uncharacterized protein n=1 Tax=Pleurodeles waltl TaxID=8319 RepID=A0AAV7TBU3_PLEWA|nr:hypothetical protein NDU88_005392 [Pleurodeles waltl]